MPGSSPNLFLIKNVKTGSRLSLNAPMQVPNPHAPGLAVQMFADKPQPNNYWQLRLVPYLGNAGIVPNTTFPFYVLQIVNVWSGMALSYTAPGDAVYDPDSFHQGVTAPAVQSPPTTAAAAGETNAFNWQTWLALPSSAGDVPNQIKFQLAVGPWSELLGTMMNFPDHLLGANQGSNEGVVLQLSPTNGGQENELWTLQNTANPQPTLIFWGTTVKEPGGTAYPAELWMNFHGTGFQPGSTVTVCAMVLPDMLAGFGYTGTATVAEDGTFDASFANVVNGYPKPAPETLVPVVAVDENNYVCTFCAVACGYWYS